MPLHNTSDATGGEVVARPCTPDEVARLAAAATLHFRSPGGGGDMAREYPFLFDPPNARHLWVIEGDGAFLAHAGFWMPQVRLLGQRVRAACFGAVFTAPELRSRGLATRVLTLAVADARAAGAQLGLISGSRGLYQQRGFAPLPRTAFYLARVETAAPAQDVTPAREDDVDALVALNASEPLHFIRTPADWRRLLGAGTVLYGPGRVLVVRRRGRPIAYAAFEGKPAALRGAGPAYRAIELGGDRAALCASLGGLRAALGDGPPGLALVALPEDRALAGAATAAGWPLVHLQLAISAAVWDPALAGAPMPWYGLSYT